MNQATLITHQAHWSKEHKPTHAELTHLAHEEAELYLALKNNVYGHNVRLEQEFVSYHALLEMLIEMASVVVI